MNGSPPAPLLLHSTTTLAIAPLLRVLQAELRAADVWLWPPHNRSTLCAELHLEIHAPAAEALYIALVRCGIQLSRSAHIALAGLCSRNRFATVGTTDLKLQIRHLAPAGRGVDPISAISA